MRLDELNVINVEAIEKYAAAFLPNIEYEPARKWFQKSIRNLLINDEKSNTKVTQVSPTAPDWMKQRYKENVPLYRFAPSGDLTDKLSHIVDWLNSVYQVSQEKVAPSAPKAAARQQLVIYATKILNSINSIDIKTLLTPKAENAKHHVDDWFDALNKFVKVTGDKDQEMTAEDMQHIIDYDSGAWVELKSDKSLGIEGKLMGHCVGGYGSRVRGGGTRIFSLRDNDGQPHVTVEITDGQVVQVKGKQNKPPVEKYVPYVKDFLNKMQFPPTGGGGRYSSGARDIKQVGLVYNPETKVYGTIKEVAKVVYTTPDNYEILTTNEAQEHGEKPTYYIWKDTLQGTITQDYGRDFNINLNETDKKDAATVEKDRKIFAEGLDFLNSAFEKISVRNTDEYGFYKTPDNLKYQDINQIPVAKEFSNNISAKIVVDDDNQQKLLFLSPNAKTETNRDSRYAPILFSIDSVRAHIDNIENYEAAKINKPVFEHELAEFLNEINFKAGEGGYYSDKDFAIKLNIVQDPTTKKFATFTDAGKVVKDFGTAKILAVFTEMDRNDQSHRIYRLYENNTAEPLAEWRMNGRSIADIKIISDSFRKYIKSFVEYLNENQISGRGYYRGRHINDEKSIKRYLKEWGIVKRGEKWFAGKTSGVDSETGAGWVVEKVGSKQGNVVSPDGKKIGELKYSGAKEIEDLKYSDSVRSRSYYDGTLEVKQLVKNMYAFLRDYCRKTNIAFRPDALPSDAKEYGYVISAGHVTRINDLYPPEDLLNVDGMVWKKAAMLTKSDHPDSGYKYGLYVDNKLTLKLAIKNKEISDITIRNPNFNKEQDENRRENPKTVPFNETNIAPYIKALSELFKKEGFTAKGMFLSRAGLQLKDGELQVITDNPKVRGFIDGLIQYEDGTRWQRRTSEEWQLEKEPLEGESRYRTILSCNVSDEGITGIKVHDIESRKKPSVYRGYLNDMLDVIEEMNAADTSG